MQTAIKKVVFVSNLGGTPAMVHRKTGTVYIDERKWAQMDRHKRCFVLLHEAGHATLHGNHKNTGHQEELEADNFAFDCYAKLGYPLSEAVKALTRVLSFTKPEHYDRVRNLVKRAALYDININGNEKAAEILKKLDNRNMGLFNRFSNDLFVKMPKDHGNRPDGFWAQKFYAEGETGFSGFDLGGIIGGVGDIIGGIANAITAGPREKAEIQRLVALAPKNGTEQSANPAAYDRAIQEIEKSTKLSEQNKATLLNSVQTRKQAAIQHIQEYNSPKNVAQRKWGFALGLVRDGNNNPAVVYAAKELYEASRAAGADVQVVGGKAGADTGGLSAAVAAAMQKIQAATRPAGFTSPDAAIQFPEWVLRHPYTNSLGNTSTATTPTGAAGPVDMRAGSGLRAGSGFNLMETLRRYWWVLAVIVAAFLAYKFLLKK